MHSIPRNYHFSHVYYRVSNYIVHVPSKLTQIFLHQSLLHSTYSMRCPQRHETSFCNTFDMIHILLCTVFSTTTGPNRHISGELPVGEMHPMHCGSINCSCNHDICDVTLLCPVARNCRTYNVSICSQGADIGNGITVGSDVPCLFPVTPAVV